MAFMSSKLFYAMEQGLTLSGIGILFGVIGLIGYLKWYFIELKPPLCHSLNFLHLQIHRNVQNDARN